jgi:hypothetical protein
MCFTNEAQSLTLFRETVPWQTMQEMTLSVIEILPSEI